MRWLSTWLRLSAFLAGIAGCGGQTAPSVGKMMSTGRLVLRMNAAGSVNDVASVRVRIVQPNVSCDSPSRPLAETIVTLQGGAFDALFVLPPGDYWACIAPLDAGGEASAMCGP